MYRTANLRAGASAAAGLLAIGVMAASCTPLDPRPNILFVVWDTARADRMSLYGHERSTTPRLDVWAKRALVFDDVVSAAHIWAT